MHRTQVLLEEEQYQALRARARRDGTSMGQLVRELVAAGLEATDRRPRPRSRLKDSKGMFRAPGVRGRDHDEHLYGAG